MVGGEWKTADSDINPWWRSRNPPWNVDYSIYESWRQAYIGNMYMIINLAIGGDGHCCGDADLVKGCGIVMTNNLLNCTEGDSGWGHLFQKMMMHVRSVKVFNFDGVSGVPAGLSTCYASAEDNS